MKKSIYLLLICLIPNIYSDDQVETEEVEMEAIPVLLLVEKKPDTTKDEKPRYSLGRWPWQN